MRLNRKAMIAVFISLVVAAFAGKMGSENQRENMPLVQAAGSEGVIPQDAIRLRIIANSDSPADQQLKLAVRDQIIAAVGSKLDNSSSPEDARKILRDHLQDWNQIACEVLTSKGSSYSVHTDYGQVPFPTKLYGDQVYPAGNYEALRIVIGEGKGQNWWCVLFPPLCFVDLAHGDAVPKDMPEHLSTKLKQTQSASQGKQASTGKVIGKATASTAAGKQTFELHFALLDWLLQWFHF